jgi:streptogramin lyase
MITLGRKLLKAIIQQNKTINIEPNTHALYSSPASLIQSHLLASVFSSKVLLYALVFFSITHQLASAVGIPIHYKKYTEIASMPQTRIIHMGQDADDKIWLGTTTGIYKFDGTRFSPLYHHHSPLKNSFVLNISETKKGELWFSTFPSGIYKSTLNAAHIERKDSPSTKYPIHYYNTLVCDKKGRTWAGTYNEDHWNEPALYLLNKNGFPIKKIAFDTTAPPNERFRTDKVTKAIVASTGKIWLTTWKGLVEFDPDKETFQIYEHLSQTTQETFNCLSEDAMDGSIWVGSWGLGLLNFNIHTHQWQSFVIIKERKVTGTRNIIRGVIQKSTNELWVASYEGLYVFNTSTRTFLPLVDFSKFEEKQLIKPIECIYKDRNENLWVAVEGEGLIYIPAAQFKIKNYNFFKYKEMIGKVKISYTCYDQDYSCYVSLTYFCGGIFLTYPDGKQEKIVPSPEKDCAKYCYTTAIRHSKGIYYVLSNFGFWILDINAKKLTPAGLIKDAEHQYMNIAKGGSAFNFEGYILRFIKNDSLYIINSANKQVSIFQLPTIPHRKAYSWIADLKYLPDGSIWLFSNDHKIYVITLNANKYYYRSTIDNAEHILFHIQAINDHLAYGTSYDHLYQIDYKKLTIDQIQIPENIPTEKMGSMILDKKGILWIAAYTGILRYHINSQKFSWLGASRFIHLYDPSISFDTKLNKLYVGYDYYMSSIDLNHSPWETNKPMYVAVNSITLLNKQEIIDINSTNKSNLSFNYHDNFIQFSYSVVDFNQEHQATYEYKLSSYDAGWNAASAERIATYTGLPPGTYQLMVHASDLSMGWVTPITSIQVIIKPPFWKTWWFYTLITLSAAGIVYILFRYRFKQIRKEEQIKNTFERKVAEMEMKALRAQMNPHFIFNSLNSINGYIIRNDPFSASEYLSKFSKLIRLILDHSRLQRIPLQSELKAAELYIELEALRFSNKFDFHLILDPQIDIDGIQVPPMILQPFIENSIWHGLMHIKEKGQLTLSILLENELIHVIIEDNGVGRDSAGERKKSNPLSHESHGIQITLDRIHDAFKGARMEIEDLYHANKEAAGTRVHLYLPIHIS